MRPLVSSLLEAGEQSDFKKWLSKQLVDNGIKITSSSRGGLHIRFAMQGQLADFQKYFKPLGIDVQESPTTISGTFDTFILTMKEDNGIVKVDTTLPWVNNYIGADSKTKKLFGPKDLTPETMALNDVRMNANEIIAHVDGHLKSNYSDYYDALMKITKLSAGSGKSISLSSVDLSNFSTSDLATISKNYGEILGGIWAANNLGFKNIYFPRVSNARLIDFYGERMKIDYPVSVKSGGGGKVTITNILDALQDKVKQGKVNPAEQKSYMVFKIVAENGAREGIIKLHTYFKTEPIKELARLMETDVDSIDLESVNNWLDSFESNEDIKETIGTFLETMNTKITDAIWERNDRQRFIVSPLGEWVWKFLNQNEEIRNSMTALARQLSMIQVNVDIKKGALVFDVNRFKKAEFIFGWAGYAAGNKLGFKMKLGS